MLKIGSRIRHAWLSHGDAQHAWSPSDAGDVRHSLCGCSVPGALLSRLKRPRCLLCSHMTSAAFRIAPRRRAVNERTPLHDIRSAREHVSQAVSQLRELHVAPARRAALLSALADIDAQLLQTYRTERSGRNKRDYDRMLRLETGGSER
jgi:hypothetical protein